MSQTNCGRKRLSDIVRNGVGDVGPEVMVYLTCVLIGLGGRGVIKTSTEVAEGVPAFTC